MNKSTLFLAEWILTLIGAWAFMLGVGIVRAEWIPQCPTIGYGWALVLYLIFRATLGASIRSTMYSASKDAVRDLAKEAR